VLLASRRGGWIEAIRLDTLQTVSRIRVPTMVERVASDVSGQQLFVIAHKTRQSGCCVLFALDPQSLQLSSLLEPVQSATFTIDRLFTQRGNMGIEVFDSHTLIHLPTIRTPGIYQLRPSPDGQRLFGITHWPEPSLDLFDIGQGVMIARKAVTGVSTLTGAWLGPQYFLFTVQSGRAKLWPVRSDDGEMGHAVSLSFAGSFWDCKLTPYDVIASGARLVIYGQFGLKSDGACAVPGGFLVVDPATGAVTDRLASSLRFRQMVASSDGRALWGLDVGDPAWGKVRIVKIDAATGQVIDEKLLDSDIWYLTTGQIPHEMQGHLDLTAMIP
jgi:hypothetical protein